MDCCKTMNFLKEVKRMCKAAEQCTDCPLGPKTCKINYFFASTTAPMIDIPTIVSIVQKWSDEHPPKTYVRDFFEKFPNAQKNNKGLPRTCCVDIYGGRFNECIGCGDCCIDCWNRPMEI